MNSKNAEAPQSVQTDARLGGIHRTSFCTPKTLFQLRLKGAATILFDNRRFESKKEKALRSKALLFGNHMGKTDKDEFVVLFVCTGNTCRSPMAEGILKKMLKESDVENLKVSSAGICGWEDMPASPLTIEVAKLRGVDLSSHRSRQLTRKMVEEADLILAMSQEHINYVRRMNPKAGDKAHLLKIFLKPHPASNEDQNQGVLFIKDPIGGSLGDYERSFLEIEKEIKRMFPKLLSLVNKR